MKDRCAEKRGFRLAPAAPFRRGRRASQKGSVIRHFKMNYEMTCSMRIKPGLITQYQSRLQAKSGVTIYPAKY